MTVFTFSVADEVFERFPEYIVGWVVANLVGERANDQQATELLRAAEHRTRTVFEGKDLKEHAAIAAWRSAFSSLGWSASKYPSSIEALTKRVARGFELPAINHAVDLANATSLTYLTPIGCHDMHRSESLQVRGAVATDEFLPMGDADNEAPPEGEIVYASGSQVRTRRWVWRQSRDALVQPDATWIFFPVDGFADTTLSNVEAATRFLHSSVSDVLGGSAKSGMVSATERTVSFESPTG